MLGFEQRIVVRFRLRLARPGVTALGITGINSGFAHRTPAIGGERRALT
jgi:hypothetical protein